MPSTDFFTEQSHVQVINMYILPPNWSQPVTRFVLRNYSGSCVIVSGNVLSRVVSSYHPRVHRDRIVQKSHNSVTI